MTDADKHIRILHLSDIHLKVAAQAQRYFTQLATDLTQNLKVKQLDYLIISGDIANRSTDEEYEAAFVLVDKLVKRYGLDPNRIIIVPGNHDLNWELSEDAYDFVPKRKLPDPLPEGRYIDAGSAGALICNEDKYKKRFEYFNDRFYQKIYNKAYPEEYAQQAILHSCPEDKILFLALNSCWEIDHEYKDRAGIHPNAITNALDKILMGNYDDWLKVAIWHHPVNSSESMKDVAFLEQLAVNGFQLGIHGHIHEAKDENFQYDTQRGLRIIAAGTFGAPAREQVTGIPLQYNLLTLDPESGVMTVETRKKEKVDGAWSADARWGDKNNPVPRYDIELKYGTRRKTDNSSSQLKASSQDNRPNISQSIFGGNIQVGGSINIGSVNQSNNSVTDNQSTIQLENSPSKHIILTLASSPINEARLRLDKEVREIKTVLRLAKQGYNFSLEQREAVRPDDLQDALLDVEPEIVHFGGHGTGVDGLALENEAGETQLVSTDALARLFKLLKSHVQCVILNACYSEIQAKAINEHIEYVVGMKQAIGDRAAINFSKGFYRALGNGKSIEEAFEFGCNAIDLQSLPDYLTPILLKKKDQLTIENNFKKSEYKNILQESKPLIEMTVKEELPLRKRHFRPPFYIGGCDIRIIGPRASGKTTFLATLAYYHTAASYNYMTLLDPINDDALRLVDLAEHIIKQGVELEPTNVQTVWKSPHYMFTMQLQPNLCVHPIAWLKKQDIKFNLSCVDYSGELIESLGRDIIGDYSKSFIDDCALAYGIAIIIDCTSKNDDKKYAKIFRILHQELNYRFQRSNRNTKKYRIAIIFSKCDQIYNYFQENSIKKFIQLNFPRTYNTFRNWGNGWGCSIAYFSCSAYGVLDEPPKPNCKNLDYGAAYGILANPDKWKPFGLIAPLYWLRTGRYDYRLKDI